MKKTIKGDVMDKIEIIVEATINEEQERKIADVADIKYRLPTLGVYVVEVPSASLRFLQSIEGVKAIKSNTHISTCHNL